MHKIMRRYAERVQTTPLVRHSLQGAAWFTMPTLLVAYLLGASPLWALVPYAGTLAWWLLVAAAFRVHAVQLRRKAGRHGR